MKNKWNDIDLRLAVLALALLVMALLAFFVEERGKPQDAPETTAVTESTTASAQESARETTATTPHTDTTQTKAPSEATTAQKTTAPETTQTAAETTATTPPQETTTETTIAEPTYTAEELEMLALVIYQEAGADYISDETRQMVGEVALNRVADCRFPDTLEGVLLQRAQYGRLYWTGLVWPRSAQDPINAHAVARAYDCAEALLSGAVERLLPSDTVWQSEFLQGTEIVAHQDGIYFCR